MNNSLYDYSELIKFYEFEHKDLFLDIAKLADGISCTIIIEGAYYDFRTSEVCISGNFKFSTSQRVIVWPKTQKASCTCQRFGTTMYACPHIIACFLKYFGHFVGRVAVANNPPKQTPMQHKQAAAPLMPDFSFGSDPGDEQLEMPSWERLFSPEQLKYLAKFRGRG